MQTAFPGGGACGQAKTKSRLENTTAYGTDRQENVRWTFLGRGQEVKRAGEPCVNSGDFLKLLVFKSPRSSS